MRAESAGDDSVLIPKCAVVLFLSLSRSSAC